MKIGQVDVPLTAKETLKDFRRDDVQGLAAQVAYHFLFSVVPLVIFLTALSGVISRKVGVNDAVNSIMTWLFAHLPTSAAAALEEPIRNVVQHQHGGFLSLGALLALWGGKNAMAALMKALNVAFDVEETRPWWKQTAVAIGLTVGLGLAIVAASVFFLAGSFVGDGIASALGLGDTWTTVWALLRWPLIALLLIVGLAFLYWAGPNVEAQFKWLTPGSVLAVIAWGITTFGLGFYFQHFAGYAKSYGVLGGVLAFVFWVYVMNVILLTGGELNATLARRHDPTTQTDLATHPAKNAGDHPPQAAHPRAAGAAMTLTGGASDDGAAAPIIGDAVPWPSAERLARRALAAEGSEGRRRRFRAAVATLGVSVATAVSAAVMHSARR